MHLRNSERRDCPSSVISTIASTNLCRPSEATLEKGLLGCTNSRVHSGKSTHKVQKTACHVMLPRLRSPPALADCSCAILKSCFHEFCGSYEFSGAATSSSLSVSAHPTAMYVPKLEFSIVASLPLGRRRRQRFARKTTLGRRTTGAKKPRGTGQAPFLDH